MKLSPDKMTFNRIKSIKIPLYFKVFVSFLGLLATLLAVVGIGARIGQGEMRSYFDKVVEERFNRAVEVLSEEMTSEGFRTGDELKLKEVAGFMRPEGVEIEIYDAEGELIFAGGKVEHGLTFEGKRPPELSGVEPNVVEKVEPIIVDGESIGMIKAKFIDVNVMNPNDIRFFQRMETIFTYMIAAIILICIIVSFFVARSITKPIKAVQMTAKEISEGDLKARADVRTNTKELSELSVAINELGRKLEQEDALRMQVTSDMAHEIRTPLTSLRNFFEAFIDGVYEINEENLEKCYSEITRMSDLVDRLKDIASIEAMTIQPKLESVDIVRLSSEICDVYKPAYEKLGIQLKTDMTDTIRMTMDESHYKQILTNLISNALRYTDEGGVVEVKVYKDETSIYVKVEDNGIGMSEKDKEQIFERFYRADKSRDRATGGLGIGLTIVKKMTEYYGGQVSVESELEKGSKFILKFPL